MKRTLLLLCVLVISVNSNAQEEKYISLFVYNFTKYFDWPTEAKSGDFIIEVLGHKSVTEELKKLAEGKNVGQQKIVVRQITSPEQISNPQILFLGHWQGRHLESAIKKIHGKPVLLVSEYEGLLDMGSIINFIIRDGTIKFELSMKNAEARNLQVDLRLKELAVNVQE